ncbi:hypothetical protein TGDOM2_272383 [Toxoplasma gondii GAB2-2007-GAL-DOM2]|uniref:Uncharacterized protein n=6 Tax=Toxoplasma gondii TaxID=5811 RepID=S7WJI8_TOXGG|nr:hypothetical protein TGGT1_272383 [Toxoplasma gondii GT1]KFG43219.1 hypothetical protein TGDOM2_272383 [Toxoplasma gondii GAB2-2007-GAL-DOM2]KFG50298.1 hypothetical protein TGFOU_272383 [Toxoplasma gondii FOU]KFG51822.1 hypothetical protein TGP89_272383 [Toxoplasma gondii p89]PUA92304.1 hypothetical protein TGBR9_272383 [Toxoplasma gondii TgCATBr9]RQX75454.1 hypothetical protein TGCAST_272383 [Toxoplasma gondii CAST]
MWEAPYVPNLDCTQVAVRIHYVSLFRSSLVAFSGAAEPAGGEKKPDGLSGRETETVSHRDERPSWDNSHDEGRQRATDASVSHSADSRVTSVIIGEAFQWGAGVSGLQKGEFLLLLPSQECVLYSDRKSSVDRTVTKIDDTASDRPTVAVAPFPSCVPLPASLFKSKEAASLGVPGSADVLRLAFAFPLHLEALSCSSQYLRPEEDETVAICCASLHQATALVENLLPRKVVVHVFVRESGDNLSAHVRGADAGSTASLSSSLSLSLSLCKLPSVSLHRKNLHVHRLDAAAFPDILLSATAHLGVNALLLLPGCESPTPTEVARHRNASAPSSGLERSLLSAGLACLAVGGRILTGCDVCTVDEFEVDCMQSKAATLSFLPSPLSPAVTSYLGKNLRKSLGSAGGTDEPVSCVFPACVSRCLHHSLVQDTE